MGSHASRSAARAKATKLTKAAPHADDAAAVFDALRRIVRRLRTFERDSIAGLGIGPAQLFVLSRLGEREATSIRDLADRTMTDPSSVSVVLSKLVSLGLVKKSADADDARRHVLALTAKGRTALTTAPVTPQAQLVAALEQLPVARRRAIVRSLDSLVSALGAEATEPTLFFEDDPPRKRRAGTKHVRS